MYLLTYLFFITRDQVAFLLLIALQQFQSHFSAHNCRPVSALLSLIPSFIVNLGMSPAEQFESWHDELLTARSLDNKASRWFNMLSRQSDRNDLHDTLMKSLLSTNRDSFRNIIILLVLGCTLLATSLC